VDRLPSNLPLNWQSVRRGEVLPWPERRRWSWEEKAQIVAESLAPNAVASAIARRYGLHRNQLYAWRKELRKRTDGGPEAGGSLEFVPVVVTEERDVARASAIEIDLSGARVRVSTGVDPALLADVLRTLKALG
jgi:transposase